MLFDLCKEIKLNVDLFNLDHIFKLKNSLLNIIPSYLMTKKLHLISFNFSVSKIMCHF